MRMATNICYRIDIIGQVQALARCKHDHDRDREQAQASYIAIG